MSMDNTWGPLIAGVFLSFSVSVILKLGDIIELLEDMKELQIIAVGS